MNTTNDYIYLAPLRGVTDRIFRNTFEKHFGKFDFLLAPFTPTVKGTFVNPSHIRDLSVEHNDCKRVIPQIIGNMPDDIFVLANHFKSMGYQSVNINMGCPQPQIIRKRRGSGMLGHPDLIKSILDKLFENQEQVVSVKMRLGYSSAEESEKIISIFNQYPLHEVIIHPRTGIQMYSGNVDLEHFLIRSQALKHPVVYNGDIWSLNHYKQYKQRFPHINRWMTGRGTCCNPYLLQEIRTGSAVRKDFSVIKAFHDDIFELSKERLSGPAHLLGKMKELWNYLSQLFPDSKRVLKSVQKRTSVGNYVADVEELFRVTS
jgi:tRNA-dihydrouridine synthase